MPYLSQNSQVNHFPETLTRTVGILWSSVTGACIASNQSSDSKVWQLFLRLSYYPLLDMSRSVDIHSNLRRKPDPELATESNDKGFLSRLNAVRLIVVTLIAIGYASTMSIGPGSVEWLNTFGYDPSLYGLQVLFFLSGWLAWRRLSLGRSVQSFVHNRALRILPWVALYTAIVVAGLYPVLCDHDAPLTKGITDLFLYFVKTVTLIQPGEPMPGALDSALYACSLQGTIWTLRWGALAYIAILVLHSLRLRQNSLYLIALIGMIIGHIAVNSWTDMTEAETLQPLIPGLRLGMAFLLGIVVRQNMHHLPKTLRGWLIIAFSLIGLAAAHYYCFPWSYGIELIATAGWCALAMALLYSKSNLLSDWTDIILPVYLGIWPITQVWLYAVPDIDVPQLIILALATTFAVAIAFRGLASLLLRPIHRRVQTA